MILNWFITGFVDAEWSFGVNLRKTSTRLGWSIEPFFVIGLHQGKNGLGTDS